jgi:uncharacterized protein
MTQYDLEWSYEWDELKSARNSVERGLPFDVAIALFDGLVVETTDGRRDYGEVRLLATGKVAGEILVCVDTNRDPTTRRIISLRRASRRERNAYRAAYPG